MINKQTLIDFETKIESLYSAGKIKGVIHLRDGNEDQLIKIFENINEKDYVFSTWANHYHALLKGIPSEKVQARILEGESMAMNFPDYNFYTSAIVGGICPIAVGTAYGLLKNNNHNRVYVFIGDMCVTTGIANECIRYSINHNLNITWIIEDNNKSVMTKTREMCGEDIDKYIENLIKASLETSVNILHYKYTSKFPHSGVGKFVSF